MDTKYPKKLLNPCVFHQNRFFLKNPPFSPVLTKGHFRQVADNRLQTQNTVKQSTQRVADHVFKPGLVGVVVAVAAARAVVIVVCRASSVVCHRRSGFQSGQLRGYNRCRVSRPLSQLCSGRGRGRVTLQAARVIAGQSTLGPSYREVSQLHVRLSSWSKRKRPVKSRLPLVGWLKPQMAAVLMWSFFQCRLSVCPSLVRYAEQPHAALAKGWRMGLLHAQQEEGETL